MAKRSASAIKKEKERLLPREKKDPNYALDFLAQRLYNERMKRGWSIAMVAEKSGCSTPTIFNLERKNNRASIVTVGKIARAFGLNLKEFFAGELTSPPPVIQGRRARGLATRTYQPFDENGNPVIMLERME